MTFDALIAAAAALAGSLFGIIGSILVLRLQHNFEQRKTDRERLFTLKKELCIELAAVAHNPSKFLLAISDPEAKALTANYMDDVSLAATKARMIAGPDTVRRLAALEQYVSESFAELSPMRFEMDLRHSDFKTLSRTFEQTQTPDNERRLREAGLQLMNLRFELTQASLKLNSRCAEMIEAVIVELRKELGLAMLPNDRKAIQQMNDVSAQKRDAALAKIKTRMDEVLRPRS